MEKLNLNNQVITLCGSTKYKLHYQLVNTWLTLNDNIVISVSCFGHTDKLPFQENEKELLDKVHKDKIYISDTIFVIDPNKYVGHSTLSEIGYAENHKRNIFYLSEYYKDFMNWVGDKVNLGWWSNIDVFSELSKEKNQ